MIKFTHASKGHEFMIDVVCTEETGPLSHEVFKEGEEGEDEAEAGEDGDEAPVE